ncbi:MAG: MoxR family ATPase [Thermoprotei archaeon]|nr:MAG: MoxR family ATPase [Thermoprotei archaeon]
MLGFLKNIKFMRKSSGNPMFEKVRLFYNALSAPFIQREEEAEVIVLSILSGEHTLFIGEPGTAKSAIVRRAASLLKAKYFYYVLNKYTEPDELFGPIDINELKTKGIYKRKIEGKLPLAEIAFLDEIFNANTAILNTLLSLLQERIFINGDEKIQSPLISLFSASNDIPDESELRALYDRLLFRHYVRPVSESKLKDLFKAGIEIELKGVIEEEPIMEISELKKVQEHVCYVLEKVKNNKDILQQYARLIVIFREQGIHVTDRRAIKGLKAIAANAVFDCRDHVEPKDFMALKYVIPETVDDFGKVAAIVSEEIRLPSRYLKDLEILERNIMRLRKEIRRIPTYDFRIINYSRELLIIERKLRKIAREAIDDNEVLNRIEKLLEIIGEIKDSLVSKSSLYGKDL